MSNRSGSIRRFSRCSSTLCLAVLVAAVSTLPAHASSQARIVRLSDVHGLVQIDKNSGLGFENAFLNLPVTQGTQLRTRDNGRVEIEFEDGSTLRLAPNSQLTFSTLNLNDAGTRISAINLIDGTAYVNWLGKDSDQFTMNFSGENVSLDHAAHFRVFTSVAQTKVAVFKGVVQVAGPAGTVIVEKRKMVTFAGDDKPTLAKNIEEEPLDSWDKQAVDYHDQYSAKNNSSPYAYGLSDLNYYGAYTPVPGYGMLWQPFFAGAGWNPFMDGAWSWYPGAGYMFVSAYPWGWMPYRYGTWVTVPGVGWMWQPGNWTTWSAMPNYAISTPPGFHPPVAPSGTVKTIVVGRGGPVLSPTLPSRLTIARGSAGLDVPRGAVADLKSVNHQVAKSGLVQLEPMPHFGASSGATFGSRTGSSYSPLSMGDSMSPSGMRTNTNATTNSSHASGGGEHH